MKALATPLAALGLAMMAAGCSETTQDAAQETAERAAADTAANAEVLGEMAEDAAIIAADKVSEGAGNLRDDMAEDEASEPDPGPAPITGDDL